MPYVNDYQQIFTVTAIGSAQQLTPSTVTATGRTAFISGLTLSVVSTSSGTGQITLGSLVGTSAGNNTMTIQFPVTAGSATLLQQNFNTPIQNSGPGSNITLTCSAFTGATSTNITFWGYYI
jgi:hypothetical protein